MGKLRAFFQHHRGLAALVVVLALALKALIPAGTMIESQTRSIVIAICDGTQHQTLAAIALPQTGKAEDGRTDHGKAISVCPYAVLGGMGLADAPGVPLTIAPILASAPAFPTSMAPAPLRTFHALPPPRGPPGAIALI